MRWSLSSFVLFMCLYSSFSLGYAQPSQFDRETSQLKAIVFLSATCPCSQSHVDYLNQLNSLYSDFTIYGVITDDPEVSGIETVKKYYTEQRFKFPIIDDPDQILVKKYNALKTPHVVLLKKHHNGVFEKIYEGGVTDRRQFSQSKSKFLEEDLLALKQAKPVPHKVGRSLGCYIRRF